MDCNSKHNMRMKCDYVTSRYVRVGTDVHNCLLMLYCIYMCTHECKMYVYVEYRSVATMNDAQI